MTADDMRAKFPTLVEFIDSIKAEFGPGVRVKWLRDDITGEEVGRQSTGYVPAPVSDPLAVTATRPQRERTPAMVAGSKSPPTSSTTRGRAGSRTRHYS